MVSSCPSYISFQRRPWLAVIFFSKLFCDIDSDDDHGVGCHSAHSMRVRFLSTILQFFNKR